MPTLNWIGKDKVVNHHLDVPFRTLERQYTFAPSGQDDGNMIIHGDNLEALKALEAGNTADDIDYEWHGNVSKAHPYQPEDRRIVYKD